AEDVAGDAEAGQLGGAQVADDRRVGEQQGGLGDQGGEGRDGQQEDLPVEIAAGPVQRLMRGLPLGVTRRLGSQDQRGAIRIAPSSRIVSPFSIGLVMIDSTSWAYSDGCPSRLGCGTCLP